MTIKECLFMKTCRDYQTPACNAFCRPYNELYNKGKRERALCTSQAITQFDQRAQVDNHVPCSTKTRIKVPPRVLAVRKAD